MFWGSRVVREAFYSKMLRSVYAKRGNLVFQPMPLWELCGSSPGAWAACHGLCLLSCLSPLLGTCTLCLPIAQSWHSFSCYSTCLCVHFSQLPLLFDLFFNISM
jgi:hypothetical protein